jgi:hypothetical protein
VGFKQIEKKRNENLRTVLKQSTKWEDEKERKVKLGTVSSKAQGGG